jgi:hypothetical protein
MSTLTRQGQADSAWSIDGFRLSGNPPVRCSSENPPRPEQSLQFHKLPDRYFRQDRPDAQSLLVQSRRLC